MRTITIGRSSSNDIVLEDKSISKFHAKLVFKDDGTLWVHDLNSTNGTFVNGVKVFESKQLQLQDQLRLGATSFPWQDYLIVEESSPKSQNSITEEALFTTQKKKFNIPSWLILSLALVMLLVFAYTQNFWGLLDSKNSQNHSKWDLKNDPIEYNMACMRDSSIVNNTIGVMSDVKKEVMGMEKAEVSLQEEREVGQQVKEQIDQSYTYSKDAAVQQRIDQICQKLIAQMKQPRFQYEWYVLESEQINAFTAGGKIFITTGIINFANSDDEIACILGHEIYHNELGHIKDKLKEIKVANKIFGEEFGNIAAAASSVLTASFNQENEAYCDMYGLDLAVKAGYDGCAAIDLWQRMSQQEEEGVAKLFRTHPYSTERATCIHQHIDLNYYTTCSHSSD